MYKEVQVSREGMEARSDRRKYEKCMEHDSREEGVTSPWMSEDRTMQEQLSRVKHDCMDAGGRAMHGAIAEEARTEFLVSRNLEDFALTPIILFSSFRPTSRNLENVV